MIKATIISPTNTFDVKADNLKHLAAKAKRFAWLIRSPVWVKLDGVKAVFCPVPTTQPPQACVACGMIQD